MTESWLRMGPEEYHKLQMEILTYGAKMVRPGGKLIYSTCTFSPEEDAGGVSRMVSAGAFRISILVGSE